MERGFEQLVKARADNSVGVDIERSFALVQLLGKIDVVIGCGDKRVSRCKKSEFRLELHVAASEFR